MKQRKEVNVNGDSAMTRREMVVLAGVTAAVMCGVGGGLGGCASTEEKEKLLITSGVVNLGPASDFPAGTANTRFMDMYGIVVVNSSGEPAAIRPKCTHKGCMAKWEEDHKEFICPGHGSRYDLMGRVTNGPATRPLPAMLAERLADGMLTVDLTKLYAL
ncbi:MAG: Rieske (2Fe-2S) protein [Phycisphaerales bacterium]|nr:Rieske (2Fe-2S) protein [Phycisphaerales bacterium]